MKRVAYCLFETPLGSCGIAWREDPTASPALTLFQLPEERVETTESRIARRCGVDRPSTPPREIAEVIQRVCRHLDGEAQDFRDTPIDLDGARAFDREVYEAAREIPAGQTRTYGEIAKALGKPAAARAVGQALAKNPIPLIVPCHRVLAAGAKPGGFSAYGGNATKLRMLAIEGVIGIASSQRPHR